MDAPGSSTAQNGVGHDGRADGDRRDVPAGTPNSLRRSRPLPLPPARSNPGLKPVLIVLGIALVLVVVFAVAAGVTNQGPAHAPKGSNTPRAVPGTSMLAVPAARTLKPIERSGQPPGDILAAVDLPGGSTVVGVTDNSASSTQYDQQMRFTVAASESALFHFYRLDMARQGWRVFSTGAARNIDGGLEVLGQKAGSDSWYWEMGVVISPTTFGGSTGGGGAGSVSPSSPAATGVTPFTVRLFQVGDQD